MHGLTTRVIALALALALVTGVSALGDDIWIEKLHYTSVKPVGAASAPRAGAPNACLAFTARPAGSSRRSSHQ